MYNVYWMKFAMVHYIFLKCNSRFVILPFHYAGASLWRPWLLQRLVEIPKERGWFRIPWIPSLRCLYLPILQKKWIKWTQYVKVRVLQKNLVLVLCVCLICLFFKVESALYVILYFNHDATNKQIKTIPDQKHLSMKIRTFEKFDMRLRLNYKQHVTHIMERWKHKRRWPEFW